MYEDENKTHFEQFLTYLISGRFFLSLPPNLGIISVGFLDFGCGNFDHDGATEPRGFKARCPSGGRSGK